MRAWAVAALTVLGLVACKHEFEPPDRAERVAEAAERITPMLFDSIGWESEEQRLFEGNETYAAKCRRCHGTLGEGTTEYAQRRGLEVPSLVEPGWHWADSLAAVRVLVFTGHEAGMPTWGVAGITAREIDASSYYLIAQLRPDVLGAEGGG